MKTMGIRELRDRLSQCVRQVEGGARVAVTAHGRVVAELVPPGNGSGQPSLSRYGELVAAGIVQVAAQPDGVVAEWPAIHLPVGTVSELVDADRGEP